jgi:hypothetical protein
MLKKIFKAAKKAAPVIGAGLGYLYGGPALGGALSTGLGAGLGSLVGGRSAEQSLRNALIGGAAGFGAAFNRNRHNWWSCRFRIDTGGFRWFNSGGTRKSNRS